MIMNKNAKNLELVIIIFDGSDIELQQLQVKEKQTPEKLILT
jgi:hypothetical protein